MIETTIPRDQCVGLAISDQAPGASISPRVHTNRARPRTSPSGDARTYQRVKIWIRARDVRRISYRRSRTESVADGSVNPAH